MPEEKNTKEERLASLTKDKKKRNEKKVSNLNSLGLGKEKDYFLENLTMLIDSGMDLIYALNALEMETKSKPMKKHIQLIRDDISAGQPLWRAMEKTRILPPQMLYLVRLGEETGRLPQNLDIIVKQRDKQKLFRSKVRSAMIYPVLVISLALTIGTGIAWFVLPKLTGVFVQLNLELPLLTRMVIGLSQFLQEHGIIAVPLAFSALAVIIFFLFVFRKTKFIGQAILFKTPVIKKLLRYVELARFGFVLGTLLEAGLPITRAMESLSDSTTMKRYKQFYFFLRDNLAAGQSFRNAFANYKKTDKLMSTHIQQMIIAGEKSGSLPKTLLRIGTKYEIKMDETTRNLAVLLEPFLLIVVWVFVLVLALAVIMPIYSLIGGIGGTE